MTERSALIPLLDALAGTRVLVIGDVMLDRFVHGTVERISPEAPIPVLRVSGEATMLGGAGNVVRNLAALGAASRLVGVVGEDDAGRELAGLLADSPGIVPALVADGGRRTSIKTRFVAGTQQMLRADRESAEPLAEAVRERLIAEAEKAIADCAVAVLSDYAKGVLAAPVAAAVIGRARAAGKTVIVDPKGRDFSRYRGADLLTPNRAELAAATGMACEDDGQIVAAARRLIAEHAVGAVLATRSRDGMTLVTGEGAVTHLPTEAREVFDVSGAGDTVVATIAAALAAGAGLAQAAALANVAAGIVVGKAGTAVAYPAEIAAALHRQDLTSAEAKVLTLEQALDRVGLWRRRGFRVGFTNGCFDLLHPGHVALLNKARGTCDRLIVGLNSDASIGRLKGAGRPIQPEMARATVLASLASVDMVVMFAEDTPLELIRALRPDVLVKGADYARAQVVGGDFIESNGGRVVLVPLEPGHSTTGTIARINGSAGRRR